MKILFVTTGLPYPPDSGVRIPTYNFMRELSKRHEIYLFSLIHSEDEQDYIENLKPICRQIYISKLKLPGISEKNRLKDIFKLFSKLPLSIKRRESKQAKGKLIKIIRENKFDIVQIEQTAMAEYGNLVKNIPVVLNTRDIVNQMIKRQSINTKNFIKRKILYHEYKKMLIYEINVYKHFAGILTISEKDKGFFVSNGAPEEKVKVIPNGVDEDYYNFLEKSSESAVIYTGNMNYYANYDAVQYFCQDIFPHILKQKKVKFIIVGKEGKIKEFTKNEINVKTTDYVDDIRPYFQKASILVVPLRIGSGVRNKILEAMAMGRPVVSTSVGCEGLDVTDGENIIIADKPEDFAHKVISLLESPELQKKLIRAGRKLVEEKYSWENVCKKLENVYEKLKERA